LGTAAYLAPEQARGHEAGPRADIYSLGVVTYQLLSGRLPYEAGSLSELALKQQRESPVPLDQLNPHVGRELAQAVGLALAIEPEARPADALRFGDALRDGMAGVSPYSPGAPTSSMGTSATTRILSTDGPTAATRVAGRQREPTARTNRIPRVPTQRIPTPPPPRAAQPARSRRTAPAPAPAPARTRPPARRRGLRRLIGVLVLAALIVAIVAVVISVASSASHSIVHLRTVAGHDVQSVINQLRQLIGQNTK
jgi:eukaryotic-like serine/threonine-protein kinase